MLWLKFKLGHEHTEPTSKIWEYLNEAVESGREVVLHTLGRYWTRDIPTKYFNSLNRVFIFPIEIFFKNETVELLKLGKSIDSGSLAKNTKVEILEPLQKLALNESNVVIVITGKSKGLVDSAIGTIKNVHFLAEDGYFYKNSEQNQWVNISSEELTFKEIVRPIMKKYQRKLENCMVKEKESEGRFQCSCTSSSQSS